MPRGKSSPLGAETTNANGYVQVKVGEGKWVGKHVVILEQKLGRKLVPGERAIFKDGDKTNLDPSNIELSKGSTTKSLKSRIARLESEIADRLALLKDLKAQLEEATSS